MSVFSIVYTSKAAAADIVAGDAPAIDAILATARHNNQASGVHGALLFTEGQFVQVLEGDRTAVQTIFDHIAVDPRHRDVEILCTQTSSRPRFYEWSMAFVGDTPALRQRFADTPLAGIAHQPSGDALLDFMADIARSAG